MLENDVDPFTQEPLDELGYKCVVIKQHGKQFGFDPISLGNYILKEGKPINVFTREPLSAENLEALQAALTQLYQIGIIKTPVDIIEFVKTESEDVVAYNDESSQIEFALENICLEMVSLISICTRFYDEDIANQYLLAEILPEYKNAIATLLDHSMTAGVVMFDLSLSKVMDPFRKKTRLPTRGLATAIAYIKNLQKELLEPTFSMSFSLVQ